MPGRNFNKSQEKKRYFVVGFYTFKGQIKGRISKLVILSTPSQVRVSSWLKVLYRCIAVIITQNIKWFEYVKVFTQNPPILMMQIRCSRWEKKNEFHLLHLKLHILHKTKWIKICVMKRVRCISFDQNWSKTVWQDLRSVPELDGPSPISYSTELR